MQVNKYSHNFLEYCLNTSKGMPSIHVSQPSAAESCPSLVRERRRDVPAKQGAMSHVINYPRVTQVAKIFIGECECDGHKILHMKY